MSDASNQPPPYPGEDPWAGQQSGGGQYYPGQQPYQGQQPYGGSQGQYQPPTGGGGWTPLPKHPQATTILVLGILGLILCQVLGPVAWIMGNKAIRDYDSQPGRWSGRNEINAGRILGIVATVLLILTVLAIVAMVAFFMLLAASDPDAWAEFESTTALLEGLR